jgi:rhodanese-related sulfurtransferase
VRMRRSAACPPAACTRTARDLETASAALAAEAALPAAALELEFDDLDQAAALGYVIIDIREPAELRDQPTPARTARHVPLAELLAGHNLPADARYLLVCARGARSLSATRALRERGLGEVYSLRNGIGGG